MPANEAFSEVFRQLKTILQAYAASMSVTADNDQAYSLDGPFSRKWKRTLFFGSAQVKKNYVSFYLMPVYMYPELAKKISPALKKRMQGKSCFNFQKPEPQLFVELTALTQEGFDRFRKEG